MTITKDFDEEGHFSNIKNIVQLADVPFLYVFIGLRSGIRKSARVKPK